MNTKKKTGESEIAYFVRNVLMASVASMAGEVFTIPIDAAKVRLQIQTVKAGETPRYNGLPGTIAKIASEEGTLALFNGLVPGLQRQFVAGGIRVGCYVPVREMITGPLPQGQNPSLLQKITAGMLTGAIGISIANPTDVVKVRLQAQGQLPPDQRLYKGSIDCYSQIVKQKGIGGLWIGVVPNMMRNSIVNAAELASYDQFKQIATQKFGMSSDSISTHTFCAFGAGFCAVICGSPADVLKTRMMNAAPGSPTGFFGIVGHMLKNEGFLSFYKGFQANFIRLGLWNVVMFVTLERIKIYFDPGHASKR